MAPKIHVVIDPASSQQQPILNTPNSVFHPLGVDWEVFITKKAARGLFGSQTPLAILPGGIANFRWVRILTTA